MKDKLIEQVTMNCPICNKTHVLEKRLRHTQALFKGEVVDYDELYFLCSETDDEENEFTPAKVMDENLLNVRDAYRIKKGLLTSKEIAAIRGKYGLTQSEFAALLGWGEVTVTRYESKTIQDETYDSIMRMIDGNPIMALEHLNKHKERFREDRYMTLKEMLMEIINAKGSSILKLQEIHSMYLKYQIPSEQNGYKIIDLDKLGKVMAYFASRINNLYKVKLMKLLWYSDSIYFKRNGRSMTGLVYEHMTYGALPIGFNEIMSLPSINVIEEMMYEDIAYRILPNDEITKDSFSPEEQDVLELVINKFKDYKSRQIVDYMHMEKAYLETKDYEIISYVKASELRELA